MRLGSGSYSETRAGLDPPLVVRLDAESLLKSVNA